ncbi:adipokinetic hormone/corazonin-related peptide receptor variant I-like isoform X2 [Tachypleus tridentatus]|uniref:adipokinetic hormone/corazonin-related peptide receptor variant I-like isoform X2 n=1 Tax=Tachypleus tridentatus TaxID=6853 RepID=UPI003FD2A88A
MRNYMVMENLSDILTNPNFTNETNSTGELPYTLRFNENSLREVILYAFLFLIATAGNLPVFVSLLKNRQRKSRIKLMVLHLTIADLIVTLYMIPLEIFWRVTVQWMAGNVMCKISLVIRAFGPYLSSMVLVCISVDRYYAILHPLKVTDARRRGKIMLTLAWLISFICSLPQSVVFRVQQHPQYPDFEQCVSFGFFSEIGQDRAYNIFCILALYLVPLAIIVFCYSRILCVISRRSRDNEDHLTRGQQYSGRLHLRCSNKTHIERARARTLRMTITIVLAFIWCWTPYVIIVLWYQIDLDSAQELAAEVQSALFMFAVSNSCVNPLVYGSYAFNFKNVFKTCCSSGSRCPTYFSRRSFRRTLSSNITRATNVEIRENAPKQYIVLTLKENRQPVISYQSRGHDGPPVDINRTSPRCAVERSYV